MEHDIIRDLLPLYHDDVCSGASRRAVEEHLASCPECQKALADMDAPLPAQAERPDPAGAVKSLAKTWKQGKRKAWLKGAALAAAVCLALAGAWLAATELFIFPVELEKIQLTDVRQLKDGRILYHLYIDDDRALRELTFEYAEVDGQGHMYYVPKRALLTERRQTPSLADSDQYIDLEESSGWGWVNGVDAPITHVWYGQGEDAILLFAPGMDLPDASAADEEKWGYSESAARYWAERIAPLEKG